MGYLVKIPSKNGDEYLSGKNGSQRSEDFAFIFASSDNAEDAIERAEETGLIAEGDAYA